MNLAILFWFYKDLDICSNRIELLRKSNPNTVIYGLFGGSDADASEATRIFSSKLDDLYIFTDAASAQWKWQHGEQMIAAWHRDRGIYLKWDTIFIVQWDMLLLKPLSELVPMLKLRQALFSGLRPAKEVVSWWGWLKHGDAQKRDDSVSFRKYLLEKQSYAGDWLCCLFIVVCLPRHFLDRYVDAGAPVCGFLEYKLPTLAHIWKIPFCTDHPFKPWWASEPATKHVPKQQRLLNAVGEEVLFKEALLHLLEPGSIGVLHPYRSMFPPCLLDPSLARTMLASLPVDEP